MSGPIGMRPDNLTGVPDIGGAITAVQLKGDVPVAALNKALQRRRELRARFRAVGLSGLSDQEALELLLALAIPRADLAQPARHLLARFGDLRAVLAASPSELRATLRGCEEAATVLGIIRDAVVFCPRPGAPPETTEPITPAIYRLLRAVQRGPLTCHVAMRALSLKARVHFREHYLAPALQRGLIEMTIPDKPRSCRQAYRLTPAGRSVLRAWKGAK